MRSRHTYTLPLNTNYGGILQAYALQTVLERMGYETCLIEKKRRPARPPLWNALLVYGKTRIEKHCGIFVPRIQRAECE